MSKIKTLKALQLFTIYNSNNRVETDPISFLSALGNPLFCIYMIQNKVKSYLSSSLYVCRYIIIVGRTTCNKKFYQYHIKFYSSTFTTFYRRRSLQKIMIIIMMITMKIIIIILTIINSEINDNNNNQL